MGAEDIKFSDMPGGTIASWAALPGLSWVQIVLIVALFDNSVFKQKPDGGPGDVIPFAWVLEIIGDDVEKGPARVGAFVLASLGMAFAGIVAAIPELASDE